jgi:hypothetical protein
VLCSARRPARCQAWLYRRRRGFRGFGRGGARVFPRAGCRRQPWRHRAADSWAWVAFDSSSPAGALKRRAAAGAGKGAARVDSSSDVRLFNKQRLFSACHWNAVKLAPKPRAATGQVSKRVKLEKGRECSKWNGTNVLTCRTE